MGEGDEKRQTSPRRFSRGPKIRLARKAQDRNRLRDKAAAEADREKRERDRSYRLALASLGLSVVVAVVTPISSLLVAKQNAASSEDQAEKAFVRDEKKAAYTDFFSAAEQLEGAEIASGMPASADPSSGDYTTRVKDLQTKSDDLDRKFALVLIASSSNTATAASKLNDFVAGKNLQDAIHLASAATAKTPGWQAQFKDLIDEVSAGHANFDGFLNAVRQDMGSDPLDLK